MRKLGHREINEVRGCDFGIIDMVPKLEPKHSPGERITNLVKIELKSVQGLSVEADFGVGMISVIDLIGRYGCIYVQRDLIQFL